MSLNRRTAAPSALVALALLATLASRPAQAQQFHLERDLDFQRSSAPGHPALRNVYWISLPYLPQISDVANSTDSRVPNKCVGEPGAPAVGDGEINVDDLICHWWTAHHDLGAEGVFAISVYDHAACTIRSRVATMRFGRPSFSGTVFPVPCAGPAPPPDCGQLRTDIGYAVNVGTKGPGADPRNHAVIEGDHDPAFLGHVVVGMPGCGPPSGQGDLLAVPYNSAYTHAVEILCGQEGVGWLDGNGDHLPDDLGDCTAGIFDGSHAISILQFLNGDPALAGINGVILLNASLRAGQLRIAGSNFQLIPGDAYLLLISPDQVGTLFLSPVI